MVAINEGVCGGRPHQDFCGCVLQATRLLCQERDTSHPPPCVCCLSSGLSFASHGTWTRVGNNADTVFFDYERTALRCSYSAGQSTHRRKVRRLTRVFWRSVPYSIGTHHALGKLWSHSRWWNRLAANNRVNVVVVPGVPSRRWNLTSSRDCCPFASCAVWMADGTLGAMDRDHGLSR